MPTTRHNPVVLNWTTNQDTSVAWINIHGQLTDNGVLIADDQLFATFPLHEEQDAWNMLKPLINYYKSNTFPQTITLLSGIKLDITVWLPLTDVLFGVVEILHLGLPIPVDN